MSQFHFRAPKDYLKSQIFSYGSEMKYMLTYSGNELNGRQLFYF